MYEDDVCLYASRIVLRKLSYISCNSQPMQFFHVYLLYNVLKISKIFTIDNFLINTQVLTESFRITLRTAKHFHLIFQTETFIFICRLLGFVLLTGLCF